MSLSTLWSLSCNLSSTWFNVSLSIFVIQRVTRSKLQPSTKRSKLQDNCITCLNVSKDPSCNSLRFGPSVIELEGQLGEPIQGCSKKRKSKRELRRRPDPFRAAPKRGNQKGNYVVVLTMFCRNSFFDSSLEEWRDGATLPIRRAFHVGDDRLLLSWPRRAVQARNRLQARQERRPAGMGSVV